MVCEKTWYTDHEGEIIEAIHKIEINSGRTDKDVIFKCIAKSSTANISFQDIEEQIEKNENIFLGIGHLISK